MSKRNHKELWEQLKVLIIYGYKKRYTQKELYNLMKSLELGQLTQDPISQILRKGEEILKKEKEV